MEKLYEHRCPAVRVPRPLLCRLLQAVLAIRRKLPFRFPATGHPTAQGDRLRAGRIPDPLMEPEFSGAWVTNWKAPVTRRSSTRKPGSGRGWMGGRVTVMSPTTNRPAASAQVAITLLEDSAPTRREKPQPFHRLFGKTPESLFNQQTLPCALTRPRGTSRADSAIAAPQRGHGIHAVQSGLPSINVTQRPVGNPYSSHQHPSQQR